MVELDQPLRRIEERLKAGAFRYVAKIDHETEAFGLKGNQNYFKTRRLAGVISVRVFHINRLRFGGETITAITAD